MPAMFLVINKYYHRPWFLMFVIFILLCEAKKMQNNHQLESAEECAIPQDRYDKEYRFGHTLRAVVVNNTKVLRGNVTIYKKTPPISYDLHVYSISSTSAKSAYLKIDNLKCKNPLIAATLKFIKFKNKPDCTLEAGIYQFQDIAVNAFQGTQYINYPPGLYLIEFAFKTKKGLVLCGEVTIKISKTRNI